MIETGGGWRRQKGVKREENESWTQTEGKSRRDLETAGCRRNVARRRPRIDPWGARTKEYKEKRSRTERGLELWGFEVLERDFKNCKFLSICLGFRFVF